MKTSELTGDALVWAVATCEGYTDLHKIEKRWPHEPHLAMMPPRREYGAVELWEIGSEHDWAFGGPIIEREGLALDLYADYPRWKSSDAYGHAEYGPTPLIAAMRCYVASKLGDEVELPKELS
jgi:hypothetical protein